MVGLLCDPDAIEVLAREGLNMDVIPNESLRAVVVWSMDYYRDSVKAPTVAVLKERWGDVLTDHDINLDEPTQESIEWAMDDLKAAYVAKENGAFCRKMLTDVSQASPEDRLEMMGDFSSRLSALVLSLQSSTSQVDLRDSGDRILTAYDEAVANRGQVQGLAFGLPEVDQHTGGIHDGEIAVVAGYAKAGKATSPDTPVLTPMGWCQIGSLRVGDEVVGSNGRPTMVMGVRRWQDRPLMRVTTDDGGSVVVDAAHDWTVTPTTQSKARVVDTETLGVIIQTNRRFAYLPVVAPVQYANQGDLPLDPYLLGVLIGDGSLTQATPTVCKPEQFIHDEIDRLLPAGDERHWYEQDRGMASIVGGRTTAVLRGFGLMGCRSWEKFIPEQYLWSSVAERRALLAGLLDTDGGVERRSITFCSTSETLARQVRGLVLSLGGTARIKVKLEPKFQGGTGRSAWVVRLRLDEIPFRLPRKRDDYENRDALKSRPPTRRIVEVVDAGRGETVCIQVAAMDGLYVTEDFILTHNSYFMDFVAYQNWMRGLCPALFTLENSIEMTEMRIACIALNISINEMQDGDLSDDDYERLRVWCTDVLHAAPNSLHIFSPSMVQRTPHAIVATARAHGADMIILDQLTFVETTRDKKDQSRAYELVDILQDLKGLVSTGRYRMPLLLAHQISREGHKSADATGQLLMRHLADSSAVERTVDWSFALYQTEDEREHHVMQFQGLGSRRKANRSFDLLWHIEVGMVGVRNPMVLGETEAPVDTTAPVVVVEAVVPEVVTTVTTTPIVSGEVNTGGHELLAL